MRSTAADCTAARCSIIEPESSRTSASETSATASTARQRFCPAAVVLPPSFNSDWTPGLVAWTAGASPNSSADKTTATPANAVAKQIYYCPMHPEVISAEPGKCPKCGMDLVLKPDAAK